MRLKTNIADKMAIGISLICTLHCLVLPILLIAVPPVSGLLALNDEIFHLWLLVAILPISIFAVVAGFIHHRSFSVSIVTASGITLLILAAALGHDLLGEAGELILTVTGSVMVAVGHFQNMKLRNVKASAA